MADPVTFFAVAGGLQAASAVAEGQMQSRAQQENASISRFNARLTRQRGREEARLVRRQGRALIAQQQASTAASGIEIGGSALDIMEATAFSIEQDALATEFDAKVRATGLRGQAAQQEAAGRAAEIGGFVQAGAAGAQLLAQNPQFIPGGSS